MAIDNNLFNELIEDYKINRDKLKQLATEIEALKDRLSEIMPTDSRDFRQRYIMDEKIKIVSSVIGNLLDIRKEISKSIKDEIEMRNKLGTDEDDINIAKLFNKMRKWGYKIENMGDTMEQKIENNKNDALQLAEQYKKMSGD